VPVRDRRVRALDLTDDETARDVLGLQRESYAVEAALIGSDGIPALTETREQLRGAGETWLGCFDTEGLSGAVAWLVLEDGTVDICRLVVAPRAFRGGVATALLDELDRLYPDHPMIVSTGSGNEPALTLYRRRGFHPVRRREAAPGLMVTELARPATSD
jgi:ribosomal protein S18 acetylase RimI-like enzyme